MPKKTATTKKKSISIIKKVSKSRSAKSNAKVSKKTSSFNYYLHEHPLNVWLSGIIGLVAIFIIAFFFQHNIIKSKQDSPQMPEAYSVTGEKIILKPKEIIRPIGQDPSDQNIYYKILIKRETPLAGRTDAIVKSTETIEDGVKLYIGIEDPKSSGNFLKTNESYTVTITPPNQLLSFKYQQQDVICPNYGQGRCTITCRGGDTCIIGTTFDSNGTNISKDFLTNEGLNVINIKFRVNDKLTSVNRNIQVTPASKNLGIAFNQATGTLTGTGYNFNNGVNCEMYIYNEGVPGTTAAHYNSTGTAKVCSQTLSSLTKGKTYYAIIFMSSGSGLNYMQDEAFFKFVR